MGMTIAEKIVARAAGLPEAHANEIHTVELDYLMSNDGTTHLTIDMYNNLKNPRIADVKKLVWIVDHNVPCDSPKTAASQKKMRDFAKANGITFYEGAGVCHQVMIENHVVPGQLIFGADSHTCAYGALGAFGTWYAPYGYVMVLGGLGLLATLATAVVDSATLTALSLLLYEMWAMPLLLAGANYLYAVLKHRLPHNRVGLLYGLVMGAGLVFLYQIFQMVLLLLGLVGVIRRRRAGKEQR